MEDGEGDSKEPTRNEDVPRRVRRKKRPPTRFRKREEGWKLAFPISAVADMLKEKGGGSQKRVGAGASIYTAAVLEALGQRACVCAVIGSSLSFLVACSRASVGEGGRGRSSRGRSIGLWR